MEHLRNIERFASPRSFFQEQAQGKYMLIRTVEKFLRDHDMPATKFGRLAAHDPRFVLDLRMGRIPRAATEARTRKWMSDFENGTLNRPDGRAEFKAMPGSFRAPLNPPPPQPHAHLQTIGTALAQEFAHAR